MQNPKSEENLKIGFVLDSDGTLVNSPDLIRRIQSEIMKRFNIVITLEREKELEAVAESMFNEDYTTKLAVKIMIRLLREVGLTFWQRAKALVIAGLMYKEEVKKLDLYPNVRELFDWFEENKFEYCIVTNSTDKKVKQYLRNNMDFFERVKSKIISKDSVQHLKPNIEPLNKASELMGVPFERIIVVGDTKYDIIFGKSVKAVTIGVLTGLYKKDFLEKHQPDFIFDTVGDIVKNQEKLTEKVKNNLNKS